MRRTIVILAISGCFEEPPDPERKIVGTTDVAPMETSESAAGGEESTDEGSAQPEMKCDLCNICTMTFPVSCVQDMICCLDPDPFSSVSYSCCPGM